MNFLIVSFDVILMGVAATFIIDLWALLLNKCFKIPSLNYAMVGRWLLILIRTGQLKHQNIQLAPIQKYEFSCGWLMHYLIGIFFAILFILLVGTSWLQQPDLYRAMLFEISTVLLSYNPV